MTQGKINCSTFLFIRMPLECWNDSVLSNAFEMMQHNQCLRNFTPSKSSCLNRRETGSWIHVSSFDGLGEPLVCTHLSFSFVEEGHYFLWSSSKEMIICTNSGRKTSCFELMGELSVRFHCMMLSIRIVFIFFFFLASLHLFCLIVFNMTSWVNQYMKCCHLWAFRILSNVTIFFFNLWC